jgi:hypothetical protein
MKQMFATIEMEPAIHTTTVFVILGGAVRNVQRCNALAFYQETQQYAVVTVHALVLILVTVYQVTMVLCAKSGTAVEFITTPLLHVLEVVYA